MSFVKLIESSSDARLQSSGAELNLSEGYERSIIREDTAKKSGAAAVGDFISNQIIKLKEDKLSVEDLNKEYGVANALVFDEPEYPSVAKRKRENKISDLTRQSILAAESFDNRFIQKGSLLAHSLGVGIATDPFTIASGGLGVLGLAGKGAGALAKTAGLSKQYQNTMAMYNAVAESKYVQFTTQAFDKAVNPVFNRLARGDKVVAAGLKTMAAANVENMIVEPFVYKQAKDNGYDYDVLQSAAIQIGFSGVAGVVGAGATALGRNAKFKNLTESNQAFKKQSRQLYNYSKLDAVFPDYVAETADAMSIKYGVNLDKGFVEAVIQQESAFNPNAQSGAGAQGLMQLMPGTAKDLGVTDVFNPAQNVRGGAEYLAQQLKTFNGDKTKALAAYNWGPGNVQKAIRNYGDSWLSHAPDETKNYVRRITKDFNQKKKFSDASAFLGKVVTNTDDFSTNVSRASAYLDNAVRGGKISKKAYTELTLKAMDDAYADNALDLDYVYATLKADQDFHAKNTFFNDLESGRYDAYLDDSQKIDLASNPDASNLRQHRFKSWIGENIGLQKLSKAIDDIDGTFRDLNIKTRTLKAVELKSKNLQNELSNLQKEFTKTQKKIDRLVAKNETKGLDVLRKNNIELQSKINKVDGQLTTANNLRNQTTGLELDGYYKQALENDPVELDFEAFRSEFKELQANLKSKKVPEVKNFANMSKDTKAAFARLYHLSNFDDIDNLSTRALVDLDDVDIETAYLDHKFKQELNRISDQDARDVHRKNIENPYYKQDRNADDLLAERDSDYFENDYINENEVQALEAEIAARAGLKDGLKQFDDEIAAINKEIKFLESETKPKRKTKVARDFDGSNEGAIAQVLSSNRIKKSSLLEMSKVSDGSSKGFVSVDGGRALDDLATEASELSGKEITPQDIVDFTEAHSSVKDYFEKRGDELNIEAPEASIDELRQEVQALKELRKNMIAEKKNFANEQEASYKKILEDFEVQKKIFDEEEALERVELEYAKCLKVG